MDTPLQATDALRRRTGSDIVGQRDLIDWLIIGHLANGNLLIEGLRGLAKTRAIKSLTRNLDARFSRTQFTPDMLPSGITGTEIYAQPPKGGQFRFAPGPIFANIVLADEINCAPAKVQATLPEAMEERQVTVSGTTHAMDPLFIVMATQNPVEDEVAVIHVLRAEETAGLADADATASPPPPPMAQPVIFEAARDITAIHVSDQIDHYMADLVQATRAPGALSDTPMPGWRAATISTRSTYGPFCP